MEKLPNAEQVRASELLNIDYMSSEVTDSEAEAQNHKQHKRKRIPKPRKVLKLKWESQEATELKCQLDHLYLTQIVKKDNMSNWAKVSRRENVFSTRTVNEDCPDWIKKAD